MSKYKIVKEYEHVLMMIEDIIGSGTTDNEQLTKLGIYLFGSDYIGTFSSDEFPKNIKDGQCFILNTDSSKSKNKTGHWVGFYKLNKKIWYYDSFARPTEKLSKFWINKRLYNTNTIDRDQSFLESDCGSRALSFLIIFRKYREKCIDVI